MSASDPKRTSSQQLTGISRPSMARVLVALRKPPRKVMKSEKVPRSGVTLIRATVIYVLALTAVLAGAVTPFPCLGEDGNQLPTKATQKVSHELLSLLQ